jgi:hypothetical protein
MLIPASLTNTSSFPKHQDVKKIESKTDRLKAELEHFKAMRSIRSCSSSSSSSTMNSARHHHHQENNNATSGDAMTTARAAINNSSSSSPKSFLASHGLRSMNQSHNINNNTNNSGDLVSLPPINKNDNFAGNSTIGAHHPPVPWSRNIATGSSSLSARFTSGKYEKPDRANIVTALMD